jgi:hypothetical protein
MQSAMSGSLCRRIYHGSSRTNLFSADGATSGEFDALLDSIEAADADTLGIADSASDRNSWTGLSVLASLEGSTGEGS